MKDSADFLEVTLDDPKDETEWNDAIDIANARNKEDSIVITVSLLRALTEKIFNINQSAWEERMGADL